MDQRGSAERKHSNRYSIATSVSPALYITVTTVDVVVLMKLLLCNHLKNHIHCSHVIHSYNYILATLAIITTITIRESIIQLAMVLRKCSLIIYTVFPRNHGTFEMSPHVFLPTHRN